MYVCPCLTLFINREFLSQGYAVIFLYRKSSLFPYTRVLDSHTVFDNFECRPDGTVSLNGSLREPFLAALERYKKVQHDIVL